MPKETYTKLLRNYTEDDTVINSLWTEIEKHYSCEKRYHHTFLHIENLLQQLLEVKDKIENWETILFSIFYHDIIYNALCSDNEEQSAEFAEKRLKQINVPNQIIKNCKTQILATKKHLENISSDTNYFIDADLSVLGEEKEIYKEYSKSIRNEFLYYPSVIHNHERIKNLKHFLDLKSVYKTDYFKNKYEKQARLNILQEINSLEMVKNEFFLTYSNQWCFNIEEDGDWFEFFQNSAEILEKTKGVEKIKYSPGFFDEGYYRFYFKKVKLNLQYEGILGIDLRTEPNPKANELKVAKEVYELLKNVRNKNYA